MSSSMNQNPRLTDIAFVVVGLLGIGIAAARMLLPIEYPSDDIRSQDWFYPVTSGVFALGGLFFVVVGAVRLIGRRDE